MGKYELQPGRGNLTSVREKRNPKGPDFKGVLKLESGEEIKLAAWVKKFDWGQAISLSIDNYKKQEFPKPIEREERDAGDVPW